MATTDQVIDDLNAVTQEELHPRIIRDVFFKGTPGLAYWRDHCLVPFLGGLFSQAIFRHAPHIGGAMSDLQNFDLTKRDTLGVTRFDRRLYGVNITQLLRQILVINKGPAQVISLVDAEHDGAMRTLNTLIAIATLNHGQDKTATSGDRTLQINGLLEMLNDGVTQTLGGDTFANYGTTARAAYTQGPLNSVPYFHGSPTTGAAGQLTYDGLEIGYNDCVFDGEQPDLLLANLAAYAFAKMRMQRQQIFAQEKDPIWGVTGFKFNGAMCLPDRYFWSSRYGVNDGDLGKYNTGTFTAGTTNASTSNLPNDGSSTVTEGEAIAMLNTSVFELRITDDELFGFGFTGYKPQLDGLSVAGQNLADINMENRDLRLSKLHFGFNS